MELSLIIPAFNEANSISETLSSYTSALSKKFRDFEIIVVANNCSDSTAELVSALSKKNPKIVLIDIPHYTGKGGAVRIGFEKASGAIVGFADADNSTKPGDFIRLAEECKKTSAVVIGSRSVQDAVLVQKQPFFRRALGKVFSIIVNILFSLGIEDTQCGAKVFPRKAMGLILSRKTVPGFEFDVQLLWIAKRNGLIIKEIGVAWENNTESKVTFLDPLKMFYGLLMLRLSGTPSARDK